MPIMSVIISSADLSEEPEVDVSEIAAEFGMSRFVSKEQRESALLEEVAFLRAAVVMGFYEDRLPAYSQGFVSHELASPITAEEANGLISMIEAKQARIDELMLEYCRDEMTVEQLANWVAHQVTVSPEIQAKIEAAICGK